MEYTTLMLLARDYLKIGPLVNGPGRDGAGMDDDAHTSATPMFRLCPSSMGIPTEAWRRRAGRRLDALTPEEKRAALREAVDGITVDKGE